MTATPVPGVYGPGQPVTPAVSRAPSRNDVLRRALEVVAARGTQYVTGDLDRRETAETFVQLLVDSWTADATAYDEDTAGATRCALDQARQLAEEIITAANRYAPDALS